MIEATATTITTTTKPGDVMVTAKEYCSKAKATMTITSTGRQPTTTMSSPSSPQHSERRKQRAVQFTPTISVHAIPTRKDFTSQEIHNCWFSRNELLNIVDDIRDAFEYGNENGNSNFMNSKHDDDDDQFCFRGLERCCKLGRQKTRKRVRRACMAVMAMQETQYDEGYLDEEEIAELYFDFAEDSIREAALVGLKDADEVLEEKEIRDCCAVDSTIEDFDDTDTNTANGDDDSASTSSSTVALTPQ